MRPLLTQRRVRLPATALVATSAVSVQLGAAFATRLFSQVGPAGAVSVRLAFAAVCLVAVARASSRGRAETSPNERLRDRPVSDLAIVIGFGLTLGGMNLSFYEAIARVPLGVAVTVEFVGPLTVAMVASRHRTDVLWALLAGGGVFLLASGDLLGTLRHLDVTGIGFALLAGSCWAGYILLNAETGQRFAGTSGLAVAMTVAAFAVVPLGAADAGAALLRPGVLGLGLGVALLSSVLPYSCEMAALRQVTPRAFGVLLSMAPAVAAVVGLAVLGQRLSGIEVAALVLVVTANVGSSWFDTRPGAAAPPYDPIA